MADPEQTLIAFFERVARRDSELLDALAAWAEFSVEPDRWCFTLPALFAFLQHHDEAFAAVDYRRFRWLLFNSPVNPAIGRLGAEVTIADNRGKVDRSTYAVVWGAAGSSGS